MSVRTVDCDDFSGISLKPEGSDLGMALPDVLVLPGGLAAIVAMTETDQGTGRRRVCSVNALKKCLSPAMSLFLRNQSLAPWLISFVGKTMTEQIWFLRDETKSRSFSIAEEAMFEPQFMSHPVCQEILVSVPASEVEDKKRSEIILGNVDMHNTMCAERHWSFSVTLE